MELIVLFLGIATVAFVVRLSCALFFPKISADIRKRPVLHVIWAFVAYIGVLVFWNPSVLRFRWIERRAQRQMVLAKVQSIGGWAALQKDCDTIVEQNRNNRFAWNRGNTNALPPALTALMPMEVTYYPPADLREPGDQSQVACVRIKIFGLHHSGGHSTPYYGLVIISGPDAEHYEPKPVNIVSDNGRLSYSQMTKRIYEIY